MADTLVLEASGEIRASSSLAWGTKIIASNSKLIYNNIEMKHMKPVIIYALPRSRSTPALYSCKREIKLFEPFSMASLHKGKKWDYAYNFLAELNANVVSSGQWEDIKTKMNDSNTVTKMLCIDLYSFAPARKWFNDSFENQTHDVFILERENREELLLSYIMAMMFGWHKSSEVEPYEFTITDQLLFRAHELIDTYLRFYPKKGKIITYENLPESHFDKSLNHSANAIDQQSYSKYKYIKNIDEFRIHIKRILDYYKDEWDNKIRNLDQS